MTRRRWGIALLLVIRLNYLQYSTATVIPIAVTRWPPSWIMHIPRGWSQDRYWSNAFLFSCTIINWRSLYVVWLRTGWAFCLQVEEEVRDREATKRCTIAVRWETRGSEWMDRGLFIVNVAYLLWYLPGMTTRAATACNWAEEQVHETEMMTINCTDQETRRQCKKGMRKDRLHCLPCGRYGQCETRASPQPPPVK